VSIDEQVIGVIGLGLLGGALAERLLQAGWRVLGYDSAADRCNELAAHGGTAAASAAEVAAGCPSVVLSLPTTEVVESVLASMAGSLRPGHVLIDTTTGEPEATAHLGRRLAEQGVDYLDATVAGSSADARLGKVTVMAGGPREAFAACADIFACFAAELFYVGPWGSGARMKLVVNLELGLNRAAVAEGLTLAANLGLEPATALTILKAGAAYSRAMDAKGDKMVRGDFTPQARLAQHLKDVRLILAAGGRAGAKMPFSELHSRLLEKLDAAGLGGLDNCAIIQAFQ
jgi:3-hydroxyisobutyrate dehydrogenase-like beta-hydroxyacid dehydrogenase